MNQNYLVDSKYSLIVTEVLKQESIKERINKADYAERERLVDEVI